MPRKIKDSDLSNRTTRSRLAPKGKPYWRLVSPGRHLGYRRLDKQRAGTWVARRYEGDGTYGERRIGVADDNLEADGRDILSFSQAQETAREWFSSVSGQSNDSESQNLTVEACMMAYLEWYLVHRKAYRRVRYSVEAHILPELGTLRMDELSTRRIREFHEQLATTAPRLRTRPGEAQNAGKLETSEDARRRKCTANRVLSILKAALNRAYQEGEVSSDEAWRRVKPFRDVEEPRLDYLSNEESVRLVNGCKPDFRLLVKAALLTGCRYGELTKLEVHDYETESCSLLVRNTKSGKSRHVFLNDEGAAFFQQAVVVDRGEALMFLKADGQRWGKSHQHRRMTDACNIAGIRRVGFHTLRHCYGSSLAMQGVELSVIAKQLGHADTRITERHYAHLAPSYVAETIRTKLPTLGILTDSNVTAMRLAQKGA